MPVSWSTCDQGGCAGVHLAGTSCLAHAADKERDAALEEFSRTGRLDVRGVVISGPLGLRIWEAFPRDADDRPTFSVARFDEATFETDAVFERARFKDDACFVGVTFKGDAVFDRATFESFIGSSHNGVFTRASFEGAAVFDEATFEGDAWFVKATFKGNAGFDRATVKHDAMFTQATFEGDVPVLGPVAVRGLDLNGVRFASPVRIDADASILSCRRGRFSGGVRFDVRRASIRLDDSDLSAPSLLTGPAVDVNAPAGKKYSQSCSRFSEPMSQVWPWGTSTWLNAGSQEHTIWTSSGWKLVQFSRSRLPGLAGNAAR